MKLCIDSANIEEIKRLYSFYPIDGVSTNPSILAKTKNAKPYELLKQIREIVGKDGELFVQVVAKDAEGMVKDGHRIVKELGTNTVVKIPCNEQGYKAMKILHSQGIRLLGTAVYTTMQGYLAAKAGCEYVAPYVNRIDNMGYDGIKVAKEIHDCIVNSGIEYSGLLAASFKNSLQVLELVKYGAKGVTCSPEIIDNFIKNACVDKAVVDFDDDFEKLTTSGITMENCE